jgi:hypothetical protein
VEVVGALSPDKRGIGMNEKISENLLVRRHVLPHWHDLSKVMQGIKGTSSRRINELLHTSGQVWQNESYDRIIRNEEEYLEKLNYMWMNPVKANLVDDPNKYPYFANPMDVISIVAPKDGGCRG